METPQGHSTPICKQEWRPKKDMWKNKDLFFDCRGYWLLHKKSYIQMGTSGAVHIACAALLFLLKVVSSMKAELFRTGTGDGDQTLFVRSCLRQDKLELVALVQPCTQHAAGQRSTQDRLNL